MTTESNHVHDWVSQCCGEPYNPDDGGRCESCWDGTSFQCGICEQRMEEPR